MPSTYTNNLGIEKPATGEQTGTWGTTVNLNFDHYDQAICGAVTVVLPATGSSGSPNDLPVTDGVTTNGRYAFVVFDDAGDLGGDAYVQLTPDDHSRIMYVQNALTNGRDIYLFQGTYSAGRDLLLENGRIALVRFTGSGAIASYCYNLLDNMQNTGTTYLVTVDVTGTLKADTITDSSAAGLTIEGVTINNNNITTSGVVDVTGTLKADVISDSSGSGVAIENVTILNGAVSTAGTITTSTYASMDHLVLPERGSAPASTAGQGKIYARNTTPSHLWYIGDTGTKYALAHTGTFTPTLQGSSYSDSEGQTYSSQVGNYILVGDLVFITGSIVLTSKGSISGALNIAHLPYGAISGFHAINVMGFQLNLSTVGSLGALVGSTAPTCTIYNNDWGATGSNPITAADITNSSTFYFSGHYRINTAGL